MVKEDQSKVIAFANPRELETWFETNHSSKTELWVKIFKKRTSIASVTWDEVVVESLCWGWIDSVKKSIDDQAYLQRITPRQRGSSWSKRNRAHVERLIAEGRMKDSGLLHVKEAKLDGRWARAYSASEIEVPTDFLDALENKPKAKEFFESLSKSKRYVIALGLTSAKKPETRRKRFDKYINLLIRHEMPS
ncbi:YdeI/OmpD-associated family protein [Alkalimarinus sediminis]|uniref:YdeI/OmpD-associated family protein n=1 Tax=Alkalimarinus sediminis TaxID=1632866 RepID=A0A9E8KQW9_9ALTE|nr:YdeI/OmpD-associated family protein [Alkalimarinus sediminis]UZW76339.1 YdeI/OmpD-associated family protein [Alkalimarinus sediminis]